MRAEKFNQVFEETVMMSSDVLINKSHEYSDDTDRLQAFKQAAHLTSEKPRKALAGMMAKHTVSIYEMVDRDECPSMGSWDEKIIDHINYLILLRALVVEELEGDSE